MSRVAYFPDERAADESEVVARIRARRGGALLNLDRMLLRSPPFAEGWNTHLGAVRRDLLLSPRLRELAVCAVAVLNDADYELQQHAPELLRAGGTSDQLHELGQLGRVTQVAEEFAAFDATERAVLQLTLEMTRHVRVSDVAFDRIRTALGDERKLVELVGVIATYNMVSRFLVALDIDLETS